jgi:hypothetical protein
VLDQADGHVESLLGAVWQALVGCGQALGVQQFFE